jgi:sugar phosphate isomerase/epimerase
MDWTSMARGLKKAGFTGVDLTVRQQQGHVMPERVTADLPKAYEAIRQEGLELPLVTTALTSGSEPAAEPICAATGKLKIPFLKPGYYRYALADVHKELRQVTADFHSLVAVAKKHGVVVGFHNHADNVGASLWEVERILAGVEARSAGYYFDVCHAVTEGGRVAWKVGMKLALANLKLVAIKDFYWEKRANGEWRVRFCPLGQGMVDWKYFFRELTASGFRGPISLHLEYETGSNDNTLAAAQKDLEFIKKHLES